MPNPRVYDITAWGQIYRTCIEGCSANSGRLLPSNCSSEAIQSTSCCHVSFSSFSPFFPVSTNYNLGRDSVDAPRSIVTWRRRPVDLVHIGLTTNGPYPLAAITSFPALLNFPSKLARVNKSQLRSDELANTQKSRKFSQIQTGERETRENRRDKISRNLEHNIRA